MYRFDLAVEKSSRFCAVSPDAIPFPAVSAFLSIEDTVLHIFRGWLACYKNRIAGSSALANCFSGIWPLKNKLFALENANLQLVLMEHVIILFKSSQLSMLRFSGRSKLELSAYFITGLYIG